MSANNTPPPVAPQAEAKLEFNINDNVRVKLNDRGREIHRKRHEELNRKIGFELEHTPPKEDSDGWSVWQLWSLMECYGEHIHLGGIPPFSTTIEIQDGFAALRAKASLAEQLAGALDVLHSVATVQMTESKRAYFAKAFEDSVNALARYRAASGATDGGAT